MPDPSKRQAEAKAADGSTPKKAKKNSDEKKKKAPNPEFELQRSLLESDPELSRRFVEGIRAKPEGITQAQFTRQFWAARQHLLKAHAFEMDQKRAMHNVFTEFKPREDNKGGAAPGEDNAKTLKLTPDQVEDVFRLHPIVRTAYNDTVPNQFKDTRSFFQAFFSSRLFKKLRGDRIRDEDRLDQVLDKYLEAEMRGETHVPHFIDLEGNEQNHSQRKGNAPDMTMRPGTSADKVIDILRALNTTSERILSNAGRQDGPAFAPVGVDEETYNQLRLHDLQGEAGEDRVRLNIKDQQQLHASASQSASKPTPSKQRPKADAAALLASLRSGLQSSTSSNSMDLSSMLSFPADDAADADADDDDDAADGEAEDAPARATSASLRRAAAQIQALVRQQTDTHAATADASARADAAAVAAALGLSEPFLQELVLTHQTTNEFLRYFWNIVLAGGSVSLVEAQHVVATLDKSLQRMARTAATLEEGRAARLKGLQQEHAREVARLRAAGLRKKAVLDEAAAGPGRQEVEWLVAPMVKAVETAKRRFDDLAKVAARAAAPAA